MSADGQEVGIGAEGLRAWVVADDVDGDNLSFVWQLSLDGAIDGVRIVEGHGSQVDLPYDVGLDGQDLSCSIDDGAAITSITWALVVLE